MVWNREVSVKLHHPRATHRYKSSVITTIGSVAIRTPSSEVLLQIKVHHAARRIPATPIL